jgi:penicillin-binding protein 1A
MAIKKNNNQAQNSDKNIAYYQRNFGKFSMEWVLLVCFYLFFMGTFGSMPSFEDLENPDSNLATEIISVMVWFRKVFRKTGLNYTMLIYQNLVQALIATEDAFLGILVLMAEEL